MLYYVVCVCGLRKLTCCIYDGVSVGLLLDLRQLYINFLDWMSVGLLLDACWLYVRFMFHFCRIRV